MGYIRFQILLTDSIYIFNVEAQWNKRKKKKEIVEQVEVKENQEERKEEETKRMAVEEKKSEGKDDIFSFLLTIFLRL